MRRDLETRQYVPTRRENGWSLFPAFGDLFNTVFPTTSGPVAGVGAPLDLVETAEDYKLVMDVPGFTMDQIDVQFADNVLTLAGEQPEKVTETAEGKGEEARWHILERSRGSFSRSIKFPVPVDGASVKAALKNGVLTVTVPKAAAARAQKIKITEA